MSDNNTALVLHTVGGSEPITIALDEQSAQDLAPRLERLLNGTASAVRTANGRSVAVNWSHVVTAHLEPLQRGQSAYGM